MLSDSPLARSPEDTAEFPMPRQPAEDPPRVRVVAEIGAATHPGRARANNEDQFFVAKMAKAMRIWATSLPRREATRFSDEEGYLMVVADGMGGAAAGEQASATAVATVESFVLNTVKWFLHLGGHEESVLVGELRQALESADREVIERAWSDAVLAGMGTTLTMGYSVGTDLFVVHAGDTRAYLLRDGELNRITADHTLVQLLIDGGALKPEDARHHSRRHVITNVLGGPRPGVHAEIHKVALRDGDTVLFCSDGLTEPVDDETIAAVLAREDDPDRACGQLIERALDAGGPDNVTVIVARYRMTSRPA